VGLRPSARGLSLQEGRMKKIFTVILVILIAAAAVVFHFRYDIFQFGAESVIKRMLPPYVHVDRIIFDLQNGVLRVKGFAVRNPRGFSNKYLATIREITCRYRMQGKTILDGIEVTDIEGTAPVINIERLRDGRLNVNEMGQMMGEAPAGGEKADVRKAPEEKPAGPKAPGKSIADVVKLTDTVKINGGKVVFLDNAVARSPYTLTFENVNGNIVLGLNRDYTAVTSVATTGGGLVNGRPGQRVDWIVSLDPDAAELTMSNRYEVRDVDLIPFKPYYDRYAPIDIERGTFSGTLVFDFDNGNIGSMNTITLRDLKFAERHGSEGAGFWDASISEIIRYLETSPGNVVFDFKIKGDMKSPRFYPGPHVKEAIQSAAIDTISDTLKGLGKGGEGGDKSDVDKVMGVVKGLLGK